MTTLVVEPLYDTLEQSINLKLESRYQIGSIMPYLYMHNAPTGTFTISIIKDSDTVASKSFSSADIKSSLSTINNYAHTFHPIIFEPQLCLGKGTCTVRLSSSGYAYSGTSFIGWVRQFEDLNNILDYVPTSDADNPLAIRLKVLKQEIA